MGECAWENEMILLFDSYDEESRFWHESIKRAGYDHVAIVVQEDDFLPDGIFPAYDLILGNCRDKVRKERYFNEIAVPDSWDIHVGSDESGSVSFRREEKGTIYYVEAEKKRLVKAVDWYDRKGVVRFRDHYNRYGDLCARTVYDNQGKPMSKTWFSSLGQEIIVENLVSGDIILNDEGREMLFQKKAKKLRKRKQIQCPFLLQVITINRIWQMKIKLLQNLLLVKLHILEFKQQKHI